MQLSILALASIFASTAFAADDPCTNVAVKQQYGGNCENYVSFYGAANFNMGQIAAFGKSTNICQTVGLFTLQVLDARVQAFNSNKDLLDILPKRCVHDLVQHQPGLFDTFFGPLDDYQEKNMFKRLEMCSNKKKYEGSSAETSLTEFCKEKKEKAQEEADRAERARLDGQNVLLLGRVKELEAQTAKGRNSAESVTFTAACIFIPIMAAAALL